MNQETKILALSLSAILKNFEKSIRISSSFWKLELLRKTNRKIDIQTDEDWEEKEIEVIIDKQLEKNIISQEAICSWNYAEIKNKIDNLVEQNSQLISTIEEILKEVTEKKDNNPNINNPF